MNDKGAFIAALLDASRRAFAAGVVLKLREVGEHEKRFVDSCGFESFVDDSQQRLMHLSEALACGRPELFIADVSWVAETYVARGVSPEVLRSLLRCMIDELEGGLPEDAVQTAVDYVCRALEGLNESVASPEPLLDGDSNTERLAKQFLIFTLEGKRVEAQELVLKQLEGGVSPSDLQGVLGRVQMELGRMWQVGEIHIAEEHMVSRAVEELLVLLRSRAESHAGTGHRVLIASVAGDLHDIGPRVVAGEFEASGWETTFLGANVPTEDLVRAVTDFTPDLVALSAGLSAHMRALAEAVAAVRAAHPRLPVLVGGRPFGLVRGLWRDVGAQGCAESATEAVKEAERLLADVA